MPFLAFRPGRLAAVVCSLRRPAGTAASRCMGGACASLLAPPIATAATDAAGHGARSPGADGLITQAAPHPAFLPRRRHHIAASCPARTTDKRPIRARDSLRDAHLVLLFELNVLVLLAISSTLLRFTWSMLQYTFGARLVRCRRHGLCTAIRARQFAERAVICWEWRPRPPRRHPGVYFSFAASLLSFPLSLPSLPPWCC